MIEYASITSACGREINEDRIGIVDDSGKKFCFAVADGLGGHGHGDEAAELAVRSAEEVFSAFSGRSDVVPMIFRAAQKRVLYEREERRLRHTMKTTLSVVAVTDKVLRCGTIGDTRIYGFENGSAAFRSHDHSLPQALADAGYISQDMVRTHPDRNRLLRCIGDPWDERNSFELMTVRTIGPGMSLLICTDGFWTNIDDDTIAGCLNSSESPAQWLSLMEETVKNSAGRIKDADNYAAVAVMCR